MRSPSADELNLPPRDAALLSEELRLTLERPGDEALIDGEVAAQLGEAYRQSSYAGELTEPPASQSYLVQVADTDANRAAGLHPGLEWIVVLDDLDLAVTGPVGADGKPAPSDALIATGYIFVDPTSGEVDLTHWTSE